jgi:hypothetical protein
MMASGTLQRPFASGSPPRIRVSILISVPVITAQGFLARFDTRSSVELNPATASLIFFTYLLSSSFSGEKVEVRIV